MNNETCNIDWSAVAAWIALAVAIISPILTAIINNVHERKMKKLEFALSREVDMISEYLDITSREILISGISDNYNKIYSKIFFYVPRSVWAEIEELNRIMTFGKEADAIFADKDKCMEKLISISKKLNNEIK